MREVRPGRAGCSPLHACDCGAHVANPQDEIDLVADAWEASFASPRRAGGMMRRKKYVAPLTHTHTNKQQRGLDSSSGRCTHPADQ